MKIAYETPTLYEAFSVPRSSVYAKMIWTIEWGDTRVAGERGIFKDDIFESSPAAARLAQFLVTRPLALLFYIRSTYSMGRRKRLISLFPKVICYTRGVILQAIFFWPAKKSAKIIYTCMRPRKSPVRPIKKTLTFSDEIKFLIIHI